MWIVIGGSVWCVAGVFFVRVLEVSCEWMHVRTDDGRQTDDLVLKLMSILVADAKYDAGAGAHPIAVADEVAVDVHRVLEHGHGFLLLLWRVCLPTSRPACGLPPLLQPLAIPVRSPHQ